MIFSYIHSAYSHAGHPIQTKIMMTQTKYDDRYLILHVSCITLVTLVTLIRQVTLATVVTLVILVTMVTLFWSSTGPRVSPFRFFSLFEEVGRFGAVESCQHLLFLADHCSTYNIL